MMCSANHGNTANMVATHAVTPDGSKHKHDKFKALDGGYSWVIVCASTVVSFFHLGLLKVYGVFVPELVDQLGMSAAAVGLTLSIGLGLRAMLGPLWSGLTRLIPYRSLTVVGGFVCGAGFIAASQSQTPAHLGCSMALVSIGSGLPLVAKVVIIRDYFDKKFSLANSIAFTGGALGMAVLAPLMELCIETYGWRGAMLILGAMNMNISVAGALYLQPYNNLVKKQQNIETGQDIDAERSIIDRVISKLKLMWKYSGFPVLVQHKILFIYLTVMTLHELVVTGWVLFLFSYAIETGFSPWIASFLSTLSGLGALVGRPVVGAICDSGLLSGRMTFFWIAVIGAVLMTLYPFVHIYWVLGLMTLIGGISLGSSAPVFVIILKEILKDDTVGFSGAVGLHYMFRGFGMIVGGPLTGWLYDTTGNFYVAFITLAVLETCAAAMILVKPIHLHGCKQLGRTKTMVQIP